ncbi:hypothetical protein TELCIR_02332 [Teladorsagia circumcincta]|uniref:AMP-binding enzyme C-terminal domain-containing protein n=1 Tax=Teladorsagia circumcincta TaxID=45464 RepID=A0A2G9UZC9_TELCI|nr:hypothetical protein TELCIR_02332 [Teladorsagia circumcincta]
MAATQCPLLIPELPLPYLQRREYAPFPHVPPAELEDILLSHPQIRDAAVIGVPHADKGEVPKAYVVRTTDTLREDDVKAFVNGQVSSYKHLAGGVEFLEAIPKSPTGKILRRVLRDRTKSRQ